MNIREFERCLYMLSVVQQTHLKREGSRGLHGDACHLIAGEVGVKCIKFLQH